MFPGRVVESFPWKTEMTKPPLACEELTSTEKPLLPGELPNCQIEHALRREDENLRSLSSSYFYTNKIVTYRNKGGNTKKQNKQTKNTKQKKKRPKTTTMLD